MNELKGESDKTLSLFINLFSKSLEDEKWVFILLTTSLLSAGVQVFLTSVPASHRQIVSSRSFKVRESFNSGTEKKSIRIRYLKLLLSGIFLLLLEVSYLSQGILRNFWEVYELAGEKADMWFFNSTMKMIWIEFSAHLYSFCYYTSWLVWVTKWARTKMSAMFCTERCRLFSLNEKLVALALKQMTLLSQLVR